MASTALSAESAQPAMVKRLWGPANSSSRTMGFCGLDTIRSFPCRNVLIVSLREHNSDPAEIRCTSMPIGRCRRKRERLPEREPFVRRLVAAEGRGAQAEILAKCFLNSFEPIQPPTKGHTAVAASATSASGPWMKSTSPWPYSALMPESTTICT